VSAGDLIHIIGSGGPDAIFLLVVFCSLLLGGRVYVRREIDYRDALISRQDEQLSRQQDLFDGALKLLDQANRRLVP